VNSEEIVHAQFCAQNYASMQLEM